MNANLKKLPALSALAALTVSMFLLAGCSAGSAAGASSSPGGSPAARSPSPSASASPSASPAASGEAASSVVYKNEEYGFDFTLPDSWKGYTVVTDKWDGTASDSQGEKTVATGPELLLRHPSWKTEKPRQDIPIMVFTLDQWDKLQKDEFHIGAAPIGPSELGRNSKYVFALPARYNFAFLEGYEEVETILSGSPIVPTENFGK